MTAGDSFIGLMSGTSLDGVDGVLAELDGAGMLVTRTHVHAGFEPDLRAELLALNTRGGADELHRAALAANALARACAGVVARLLAQRPTGAALPRAIGAHGQTVRHRPGTGFDATGYTVQLLNGALLAELTGIDVVCDFRSRDVAAGGQGAPLVPAFHAARFGVTGQARAVLNLGGIANLTLLPGDGGGVLGFDCGPANVLIDLWAQRHLRRPCDEDGAWAAGGRVDHALLARLLAEPFFAQAPPKSTGRDLFDAAWLDGHLAGSTLAPQDVMATLAELTARGVADALARHAAGTQELVVCGGGAFNRHLVARIGALASVTVRSSAELGVAPDQVEALAFAWLAQAFLARRPGNLPAVTGAAGPRVLGALYPAA
jgi:anhydro-N-acetylmuramic acid kinase